MEIYQFEYIRNKASFANKKSMFHIFERASDRLLMSSHDIANGIYNAPYNVV